MIGRIDPPKAYLIIYEGWFLLAWLSFGLALIFGCLIAMFEFFEKFAVLISYVMIPVSGAFYMVAWLPYQYRSSVILIPFVDCMEMMRRGVLGEFYPTYYNIGYTVFFAASMMIVGLFLLLFVRDRIDVE
jgi:capsular polysaccharide transport system permease protein